MSGRDDGKMEALFSGGHRPAVQRQSRCASEARRYLDARVRRLSARERMMLALSLGRRVRWISTAMRPAADQ